MSTSIPSLPDFVLWPDADPATRQALRVSYLTVQAGKQLATADRAHLRLSPILIDLDPRLASTYLASIRAFREALPDIAAEIQSLHRFSLPITQAFIEDSLHARAQQDSTTAEDET